jgi:hypothetical protein
MWETSHPLSFAVAGYALAASIMPNLVLIAAGQLVGSSPAASASGLDSAAGHPPPPDQDHGAERSVVSASCSTSSGSPGGASGGPGWVIMLVIMLVIAARIAFRPAPRGTLSET